MAGELVAAWHPDGRGFVQFSKPPFTLVTARVWPGAWRIEFPDGRRARSGKGLPPARFGWLHLYRSLAGLPLGPDWTLAHPDAGTWQLASRHTGERIDASFSP